MHVPFIDLSRTVQVIREDVLHDWQNCLDQCDFVGGPTVGKLEKSLEKKLEASHFVGCSNGTDAIIIGLQALGITAGMRVAVPNMTFWAPYEAIVQIGAIPVLVDISLDDLQMDFEEFQVGHQRFQFDAAIFVHLFGWTSARLADYRRYCKEQGITLIEDAAQAFGVRFEGRSIFEQAQLATTSFYPAKVFGGSGDGGGISTSDPKVWEKIRALCNHGRAGHYTYDYVGWNCRMGGVQAQYLIRMLDHIDHFIQSRQAAEARYLDFFADHQNFCKIYRPPVGVEGNAYLSVIYSHTQSGDELAARLKEKGIGCARTYPQTLCEQPPAKRCLRTSDLQRSREFSRRVINLPLFAGIRMEEVQVSAEALLAAFREG
ncbi:MAG: DegT/DnrJ/EryC1/StrS family aminotransferase [Oligoflexus sp.]